MNLDAERERLRDHLARSAEEIRSAEHAGWGNVIDWTITMIDAQASALAEMQKRYEGLELAAKVALHEMCMASAPCDSFTDAVDGLDAAIRARYPS